MTYKCTSIYIQCTVNQSNLTGNCYYLLSTPSRKWDEDALIPGYNIFLFPFN
jgi:hypothetical protein